MKKEMRLIILSAVLVFVLMSSLFVYNALSNKYEQSVEKSEYSSSQDITTTAGDVETAPDFIVLDEKGEEVNLSDYFGEPIVINFWASWCEPCRSELGYFDKFAAEYSDKVRFLMIDLADGVQETKKSAIEYLKEQGYDNLPLYFDTKGTASSTYGIMGIPVTFFINRDCRIETSIDGSIDQKTLKSNIQAILESDK